MFTKLFGFILIVALKITLSEARLDELDDVCTRFPTDLVRDVLQEYFKNVSEVAVFPMYAKWFSCLLQSNVWQESLSYTVYRSLNDYNQVWRLNFNGVLMLAFQKVGFKKSTTLLEFKDFEEIGLMVTFGSVGQRIGTLRSMVRMVTRTVALIIDGDNGQLCVISSDQNGVLCRGGVSSEDVSFLIDNALTDDEQVNGKLRVTMFADPNMDTNKGVVFVDEEMLQTMAKMLNFTPEYMNPYTFLGSQLPNGTFDGALGDIEYNRADLSKSQLMYYYNTTNVQFLFPTTLIQFRYVVPKNYYNTSKSRIRVSEVSSEMATFRISIFLWFPLGLVLFEWVRMKSKPGEPKPSWQKAVLGTINVVTNVSAKIRSVSSQRLYWMSLIIFQLIMYNVYVANMVQQMNLFTTTRDIESMHELLFETPLKLIPHSSMLGLIKFDEDRIKQANFTKRIQFIDADPETLLKAVARNRTMAALMADGAISKLVPTIYDPKTGENLLHVIPEVAIKFHVAALVPVTSQYFEPLNQITMQYVEGGLVDHNLESITHESYLAYIRRYRDGKFQPEAKEATMVGWKELELSFYVLGFTLLGAALCFVGELVVFRWNQKKVNRNVKRWARKMARKYFIRKQ